MPIPGINKVFKLDWASFAEMNFQEADLSSTQTATESDNKLIVRNLDLNVNEQFLIDFFE
jgi:RNA recognition motif-containing protein